MTNPQMNITSEDVSNGSTTNASSLVFTFTSSASTTDFIVSDIIVEVPERIDSVGGVEGMMITDSGETIFSKNFQSQPGFVLHNIKDDFSVNRD